MKDFFGNEIRVGDIIVYPGRQLRLLNDSATLGDTMSEALAPLSLYAPDADEREEMGHLSSKPPLIKFDGTTGKFVNTKVEGDKGVDTLTGVILGHRGGDLRGKNGGGQVLFGESLLGKDKAEELGVGAKWVCRTHDLTIPPTLNPELSTGIINEAKRAGAGRDCLSCPLRQFGEDNERPRCAAKLNLIFLSEDNNVYLVQFGGKSITCINRLLAQYADAKISSLATKVTLRGEQVKKGSQKWMEVRGEVDAIVAGKVDGHKLFPPEQFYAMRELRKGILANYNTHIDSAEQQSERHEAPPEQGFGAEDIGLDDVPF